MKIKVLFMLFVGILLNGCASIYSVEIKEYSAKYMQRADIGSVIGNDISLPLIKSWVDSDFIVMEINTKQDLVELSSRLGSTLFADIYFCEQPEDAILLGVPDLYAAGKSISNMRPGSEAARDEGYVDGSLFKYEIVLFLAWSVDRELPASAKKYTGQSYYLKYDLKEKPKDICLSLKGSNMVQKIKSNQIKLTGLDIRNIIDKR